MSNPHLMKLPHVIKEGFIHKEGHNIKKMKKRYFKLIIDIDCNPLLEYYDELDVDRRLGICNLSASTMNKPKNSRPPFLHCLRIDLIDHAMNSFVKLILGWETQPELDDWVQAFRTASSLIEAHREAALSGSYSEATSMARMFIPQTEIRPLPVDASVASTPPAGDSSDSPSVANPSPGGSTKSYQRRGSITVGNAAAAEKRDQEKAEADAEKRALLEKVSGLASSDIELLIEETTKKFEAVSVEERFNPRKQTLEEALSVMKEMLSEALKTEQLVEDQIRRINEACEDELKKFIPDPTLTSHQRLEIQSELGHYLNRLHDEMREMASSASVKIIQALDRNIQLVSARFGEWKQFEENIQARLNKAKTAKSQIMSTIGLSSISEASQLKSVYENLCSKEINPDIYDVLSNILTLCKDKIATEELLDKEADRLVGIGANLQKYARDKVLKKSKHEPVPSVVKMLSGTLMWGSHKTGPKVLDVAIGPSELLKGSGILGPSPNLNLHLHVTIADASSTGGREIIDFVGSSEGEVSKWVRGSKRQIS